MKTPITGGCACGAIRYESTTEPMMMVECHCRDCQRVSGARGVAVAIFASEAFRFTNGTPKYHFTESEWMGEHRRGFCPECGSPLTGAENREGTTGKVGVMVASLDDPSEFQTQVHVWASDAQPWDRMEDGAPKFEKYPS